MDRKKIGSFIAQLRRERKMTQEQLAQELFVDRATISKWETGSYIANPETLMALSNIFKISVNELLAGERENKENQEQINRIPVDILKNHRKKLRILTIVSLTCILFLLFSFLAYYFVSTYNSIRVYKIGGSSDNFYIDYGIMIVSREKAYIKLGQLKQQQPQNKKVNSMKLYYVKDGKKNDIYFSNDVIDLLINTFGYDEYFSYKDIYVVKENLFLDISYDNNDSDTIHLKFVQDFSNNKIFYDSIDNISKDANTVQKEKDIPKWIIDNFTFDSENNEYHLETKNKNFKTQQIYDSTVQVYFLDEIYDDYVDHFEYSYDYNSLFYSKIVNTNMVDSFSYDLENKICIDGICDFEKIDYILENYINNR